jgi:hypothetical protein
MMTARDIFDGVFQAAQEFVQVREPDILVFVSKRPERASIYGQFLRAEEPRLKALGYELMSTKVGCYSEFWLRRTIPSRWIPL